MISNRTPLIMLSSAFVTHLLPFEPFPFQGAASQHSSPVERDEDSRVQSEREELKIVVEGEKGLERDSN